MKDKYLVSKVMLGVVVSGLIFTGCYTPTRVVEYNPSDKIYAPSYSEPPKIIITAPSSGQTRGVKIVNKQSNFEIKGVVVTNNKIGSISINNASVSYSGDGSFSHSVNLTPGENVFNIVAVDSLNKTSSKRISVYASLETPERVSSSSFSTTNAGLKPSLWILSIGVSKYRNPSLNLRYAGNDAVSITNEFEKQRGKMFSDVYSKTLVNEQATRGTILSAMTSHLGQAAPGDVVLIFLAGHGIKHAQTGSYYFLPYNADTQNILYEALKWSDFEEAVKIIKTNVNKVVLMVDTCHSGALDIAMRNVQVGEDLVSSLKEASGLYILSASKSGEASLEDEKFGNHGAFTYSILRGLKGEANYRQGSHLTLNELFTYVASQVPKHTGGRQHPYFKMDGTDLPLVMYP